MNNDKDRIEKANYYFKIGNFFYDGPADREPDFAMALKNFHKADTINHKYAWKYLARMYYYGLGTAIDKKQCVIYYERQALSGDKEAQSVIGKMYLRGIGVERNYKEAIRWLKKSAKNGCTIDQYLLGLLYFRGLGVAQDFSLAWSWFEKAALLDWFSPEGYVNPPCFDVHLWLEERAHALGKLCEMSAKGLGKEVNIKEAARFYNYAMSCNPDKANACLLKMPSSKSQKIKEIYNNIQQKLERPSPKELRQKRYGMQKIKSYYGG